MAEVTVFVPRPNRSAKENLANFIEGIRDKPNPFGAAVRFDDDVWDVTSAMMASGLGRQRVTFCTLETAGSDNPLLMAQKFRDFAKSYLLYRQSLSPIRSQQQRLAALRAVDHILRQAGAALIQLTGGHFNLAAKAVMDRFSKEGAYRIGVQLELLAEFMADGRLVAAPFQWRNPIRRPTGTVRVGPKHEADRAKKLPSGEALEAVTLAFRRASYPADKLVAATAALMCSAPVRIGEILRMRANCEVEDRTATGQPAYGLRWWTEKGPEPEVRWIIPAMVSTAKAAIATIREVTAEARRIAAWYERRPAELYLPPPYEDLRDSEFVDLDVASQLLGLSAQSWAARCRLTIHARAGRPALAFREFEAAVLAQLPDGFPIVDQATGLLASEAMFLVQVNEFRTDRGTSTCMIEKVTQRQIRDGLGARAEHGTASTFSRLGLSNEDGSPIKIRTHAFRHYLNTLAQRGGLDPLDIAKWSGRKSVAQNAAYDHVSADEILEDLGRAVQGELPTIGQAAPPLIRQPASREEFTAIATGAAHVTEFGFCLHDFAMLPCQLHRDCLNCEEHVCVKGDVEKERALARVLEFGRKLLAQAEEGEALAYEGADRWRDHQKRTVDRAEQLLAIIRDPAVPDGAVIRSSGQQFAAELGIEPPALGFERSAAE
jgi:hypothetical protein